MDFSASVIAVRLRRYGIILTSLLVLALVSGCGGEDVPPAAAINAQPADQSVVEGNAATFTVSTTGATGYQWQLSTDGGTTFTDINGATGASYVTAATVLADSGRQFRVVVSGQTNSVTSSAAILTVNTAPIAPSISVHPADQSVVEGNDATFSVTASGTGLSYQWQRSTDGGSTYTDQSGATAATINLTGVVLSENGHRYRVAVTNSAGSVTSNAAVLTVSAAAAAPAFSTHPANVSVVAPDTGTFTVVASGTPTPTLQWELSTNGGTTWGPISGATSSSFTTPATGGGDDGNQYRAVATNASGTATSNAATLTVALPQAPSFTTHPADVSVTEGQNAQFTVAASGVPTPTLQWQVSTDAGANWSNIIGATGATIDLTAALTDNGHQFRAVASNSAGNTNSNVATLTVTASTTSKVIYSVGSFIFVKNDDGTNGVTLAPDATNSLQGGYAGLTPNGRVVFQAGVATASVKLDGTDRVTLADGSVRGITPNSRVIISSVDTTVTPANNDLHSVNADGTDPRTLANSTSDNEVIQNASILGSSSATDPLTNLTVGVTASGKVVYQRTPRGGGQSDVYIVNEDGTGTLALGSTTDDERFANNLPGGRIAYFRGPFLSTPNYTVLIGEDGSNPVSLDPTQGGVVGFESGRVVTRGFPNVALSAIYSFNLDGTGAVTLATGNSNNPLNVKAVSGGRVIYNQGNLQDLYSVPVDGSATPTTLATIAEQGVFRGVTSNGKVVFGVGNLFTVDLTGSNKTQITNASDFEVFRASTTDGKVIYERLVGGANYDLYIVNTDGTGVVPLAVTADIEQFAGLTPSGRVLYIRSVVGGTQLWSVKPDGTDPVMLGSGGGNSVRFHHTF